MSCKNWTLSQPGSCILPCWGGWSPLLIHIGPSQLLQMWEWEAFLEHRSYSARPSWSSLLSVIVGVHLRMSWRWCRPWHLSRRGWQRRCVGGCSLSKYSPKILWRLVGDHCSSYCGGFQLWNRQWIHWREIPVWAFQRDSSWDHGWGCKWWWWVRQNYLR